MQNHPLPSSSSEPNGWTLQTHVTSLFLETCFEEYTDFYGHTLGNEIQNVPTATDCQSKCQTTNGCKYWTYGLGSHPDYAGWCWLKTSDVNRRPNNNLISGQRFCGKLRRWYMTRIS